MQASCRAVVQIAKRDRAESGISLDRRAGTTAKGSEGRPDRRAAIGIARACAVARRVSMDLLVVLIVVAFFALAWAYTWACDRV